jgi:hypothetical protein
MTTATFSSQNEPTWSDEGDVLTQFVPADLVERYVNVALRRASIKSLHNGSSYADLGPEFPGVWADGPSPKECLDTLGDVLKDWLFVKLGMGDRDIPVVDEIDLTVIVGVLRTSGH